MYLIKTALEVIVAFFCVIGIYSLWRFITQRLIGEKNIVIAVEIFTLEDADKTEALIREALDIFLALRSQKIIVFTSEELAENERLKTAVEKYGTQLYVV